MRAGNAIDAPRGAGNRRFRNKTIATVAKSFLARVPDRPRAEYDATIGDLRSRHLQVVAGNELLSLYPGDMQKVVEGTVDALIDIGGYYRTLICLVSPAGDRIQAVAGRCVIPAAGFNFQTDYPLDRCSPEDRWDIQQWVAIKGVTVAVPDASSPEQINPRTNTDHVRQIDMKAIAVVPIRVKREGVPDEILGTIHFKRQDMQLPSEVELRSLEILAGQVATAFDQARRITMLEQALNVLEAEFRILSPDRRVVFHNRAAAKTDGASSASWQYPISLPVGGKAATPLQHDVIEDAAKQDAGVHRYVTQNGATAHLRFRRIRGPDPRLPCAPRRNLQV